jgi:hypothetical protein
MMQYYAQNVCDRSRGFLCLWFLRRWLAFTGVVNIAHFIVRPLSWVASLFFLFGGGPGGPLQH